MIREAVDANHTLWCVAHTFGSTSANNTIIEVTDITLMRKTIQKSKWKPVSQLSIKILDISMIPIFTKLLVISIAASNVLGCSSKVTIRLKEGCCLVFNIFISFEVSEKKATSLPATRKEIIKRTNIMKISMVVAAGVICKKISSRSIPFSMTEW